VTYRRRGLPPDDLGSPGGPASVPRRGRIRKNGAVAALRKFDNRRGRGVYDAKPPFFNTRQFFIPPFLEIALMFRHAVAAAMCLALLPAGAAGQSAAVIETNLLLTDWTTPFQVPPFGEIKPVLDQDAFAAFRENGLFDAATARSFRTNILERGGTADAMTLDTNFRGREPSVEPLLRKRGWKSRTN